VRYVVVSECDVNEDRGGGFLKVEEIGYGILGIRYIVCRPVMSTV
jgi:hypothetical protein